MGARRTETRVSPRQHVQVDASRYVPFRQFISFILFYSTRHVIHIYTYSSVLLYYILVLYYSRSVGGRGEGGRGVRCQT